MVFGRLSKLNKKDTMYTINPQTGRPIKNTGRVYKDLVRRGVLEAGEVEDARVLEGNDDRETIKALNRRLSSDQQAVRGRGKYKGAAVIRNMPRGIGRKKREC